MPDYKAYPQIETNLLRTKKSWRTTVILEGIFAFVTVVLSALLLFAFAETLLHLPGVVRKSMFLALTVLTVGGAAYFVFRPILGEWTP